MINGPDVHALLYLLTRIIVLSWRVLDELRLCDMCIVQMRPWQSP